jgi:2-methylisocitrate lyase-like PEP mutase family enzyme
VSALDEALDRAGRYQEAGADVLFVEAPESVDEMRLIGDRLSGPLLANMVEGGKTPLLTAAELADLGFSMVLFANAPLRAAQRAITTLLRELSETGSTNAVLGQLATWDERQEAVGKSSFDALELKYATGDAS